MVQYSLVTFLFFVLLSGESTPLSWDSFTQKKHYKTAIQSECRVPQGPFSQWLRWKLCTQWFSNYKPESPYCLGGGVPQVPQWHDASVGRFKCASAYGTIHAYNI